VSLLQLLVLTQNISWNYIPLEWTSLIGNSENLMCYPTPTPKLWIYSVELQIIQFFQKLYWFFKLNLYNFLVHAHKNKQWNAVCLVFLIFTVHLKRKEKYFLKVIRFPGALAKEFIFLLFWRKSIVSLNITVCYFQSQASGPSRPLVDLVDH
jgi:hypothetical protein